MGNFSELSFDHMRNANPMDLSREAQLILAALTWELRCGKSAKKPTNNTSVTTQINKSQPVNPPVLRLAWFGFMRVFGLCPCTSTPDAVAVSALNLRFPRRL
jgi:hypothetical protein